MKILSVYAENFASYEKLEFSFDDKGLVLIHGATGSGKSTLCDVIPWILFGITAKNGKADDVISWNGGNTHGMLVVRAGDKDMCIKRHRGNNNDLAYWILNDDIDANIAVKRGKDINDTQKFINQFLGLDADLYLAGAYFHEFSQTAQFFTTTAKNRREITEQLVDLSLPTKLQEKIKDQTKINTIEINTLNNNLFTLNAKLELLQESAKEAKNSNAIWAHEQSNRISTIEMKRDTFEITRSHKVKAVEAELDTIKFNPPITYDIELQKLQKSIPPESVPCETCGMPKANAERQEILNEIAELKLQKQNNSMQLKSHHDLTVKLNEIKDQENPYENQLIEVKHQVNPHSDILTRLSRDISKNNALLDNAIKTEKELKDSQLNLELLSDAVMMFRSELVRTTVKYLEATTVSHLRDFFEGEITVELDIQDRDKLDISIRKNGNECSYTQLSKGQRQMLKLCFGAAVMECIQRHHALEFNQLFFDEALDGLDDTNKLRAVKMLETLASRRDTVYLVEHSEGVKAHIDQKYFVELIDGKSIVCLA